MFIIVNPVAGRGRTRKLWPAIEAHLKTYPIIYDACFTHAAGEARYLAAQAAHEGHRGVVAVGGDGTAHEVANGLMSFNANTAALGVLPTGGGNDFCKAIGVPLELPKAVETLAHGRRRRIDVGRIGERYFINGLGIGLDGAVSRRYRRMKRLRGEVGYLWGAIHEALTFREFEIDLATADWRHRGPALLAGATNGQYHGGDFKLAPAARVDDGRLDIYVMSAMAPLKRLIQIPKVRRGAHLALEEFQIRRASWVEVTLDRPLPAHMDGESFVLPQGCTHIDMIPRALEVISGAPERSEF